MNLRIARMDMEHGKRCIRFAKALRLDFFPQLVRPATGGPAYLPSQVIDIFPQEEPQPISRNISIP